MSQDLLSHLSNSLIDGDPEAAVEWTQKALAAGIEPLAVIQQGLAQGMAQVGESFACGDAFLPDLFMAAEAMKGAMKLLEPELAARNQALETAGVVVIGTVQGDIHEIGKSLVATMLSANGFKVHDLGVDVPPARFVETARATGANLVGVSALLTTTMPGQREVIRVLEQAGLRAKVKVMVGGAPVTRGWAEEIGADGYAEDAMGAVNVAKQILKTGE